MPQASVLHYAPPQQRRSGQFVRLRVKGGDVPLVEEEKVDTLAAGNHSASEVDYVGVGPRVGRPRVLLVDGARSVRRMCSRHLRLKGFEVMEAADGRSGLEQARLEAPDLILSDVRMPGLDGFALAEALRGDERTCDVPIVFLSGEPDPADRMRAWRLGLAGFVAKPFEPAALATLLAGVIERNAASDGYVVH